MALPVQKTSMAPLASFKQSAVFLHSHRLFPSGYTPHFLEHIVLLSFARLQKLLLLPYDPCPAASYTSPATAASTCLSPLTD